MARDLFPGALEMMVLRLVRQQPLHGYALVQRIRQVSNDLLQVEEGSLYPALQRLLKAKLLRAEWGVSATNRRVRIYSITAAGRKHLAAQVSSFEQMLEGISLVGGEQEVTDGLARVAAAGATDFAAVVMGGNADELSRTRAVLSAFAG